jgi:hypothetical protein
MSHRSSRPMAFVVAGALGLLACGDGGPAAPSGAEEGVTVRGVLLGEGAAFTASSAARSGGGPITVAVKGTSISVTISGNGTFEIEDIPAGPFVLLFLQGDVELGRISMTAVDGAVIKIVVKKRGAVIVLVEMKLDDDQTAGNASTACLISGGRVGGLIELEGNVVSGDSTGFTMTTEGGRASDRIDVDTNGGSVSFKCNGNTAVNGDCPAAVQEGAKVHVRGTLNECDSSGAVVAATEVKVQKAG